jgi:multisubunit Na+/H+ antiporter MnhB subunit
MSHFSQWFDYKASLKILFYGMLAGAALPGLFALGVRLQAVGSGAVTGGSQQRKPVLIAAAWVIYGLVVAVILLALLYISRDFISHNIGQSFLGGKVATKH